jgi:hypothetical protein
MQLSEFIDIIQHLIFCLTKRTDAYVTLDDIEDIESFNDDSIITIQASPGTKLEVPYPKEVCRMIFYFFKYDAGMSDKQNHKKPLVF